MSLPLRILSPEQKAAYEIASDTEWRPHFHPDAPVMRFAGSDFNFSWNALVEAYRCGRKLPK
jgi:hypothetical protein